MVQNIYFCSESKLIMSRRAMTCWVKHLALILRTGIGGLSSQVEVQVGIKTYENVTISHPWPKDNGNYTAQRTHYST